MGRLQTSDRKNATGFGLMAENHRNNTGLLSICKCAKDKDVRKDREEIIECQKKCEKWPTEKHKQFRDGYCWHFRPQTTHCDYYGDIE